MKSYSAKTNIKASPGTIWKILMDAAHWPDWDPWTIRIEGTLSLGESVKAYSKLDPDRAYAVKVTECLPRQAMVWSGGMPLGLFKGVRTFTLMPKADGSVDFELREEFSGPLLSFMAKSLPDMTQPFQDFVNGLKARAEKTQPSTKP
jgi:hypothetical protein